MWIQAKLLGPDRSASCSNGSDRSEADRAGASRTDWTGPNRTEHDRIGRQRIGPCGLEYPSLVYPLWVGWVGRSFSCLQAIVLSHSRAPIEERMPYHGIRLEPVKPVIFMGRSAHVEPAIEVRMAMYCFYRELPIETRALRRVDVFGSHVRAVRRT